MMWARDVVLAIALIYRTASQLTTGLLILLALVLPARWAWSGPAGEAAILVDGTEVALWRPPAGAAEPYPLVLFSHGVNGCRDQSGALMAALAAQGMLVAAVNHADQRCGHFTPVLPEIFATPQDWTDATYRDRAEQLRALRQSLMADLGNQIDPDRLILIGHSLGGYTVLGLAGARPAWKLADVTAVVAWAPYTAPYLATSATSSIDVPVLYQLGSRDSLITPAARQAFAATPNPACLVMLTGAGHLAWVDPEQLPSDLRDPGYTDESAASTLGFLQAALAGTDLGTGIAGAGTCR